MARIGLIWAEAHDGVIGAGGVMPWHLPEDLAHFKAVTIGAPVVMGRKTWESLSPRFRPLPGRRNLVVTRRPDAVFEGAEAAASVEAALDQAAQGRADDEFVWIIGGAELYRQTIGVADRLEVTRLDAAVAGDTVAPPVDDSWRLTATDPIDGAHVSASGIAYRFLTYERR